MLASVSREERQPAEAVRSERPRRILVAEDDEEMIGLLVGALQRAGYDTISCHDGLELLRRLEFTGANDSEEFDLVISDIRMPHISGMDVLRARSLGCDFPPIILITAFGDDWTHGKARYLGAVDVFDKPFDIGELVNRVRQLVPLSG